MKFRSKNILSNLFVLIFIILILIFPYSKITGIISLLFYIYVGWCISKKSKWEYWVKLFPNIIGGLIAGFIIVLLTVEELLILNIRDANLIFAIIVFLLFLYFTHIKEIQKKKKNKSVL